MIKKALSYSLGLAVGLLAVAPPIDYKIPIMVNSFWWVYAVVAFALLAVHLIFTDLPQSLKLVVLYIFGTCFWSMAPYLSFNAFLLVVVAAYGFIAFTKSDYSPILDMVAAAFFVQMFCGVMQLFGKDTLMNINRPEPVFLGTVMQYMRFGSLLAIMAPLLVWRNKLFIIPIVITACISQSSGYGLAVIAGVAVYALMTFKGNRWLVVILGLSAVALYCVWDRGSIRTAFTCGRVCVWGDIIRTWWMNTLNDASLPLHGPVDIKSILFGRGLDTFIGLFPIFKHDGNPFWQAHNCHLQFLWEGGLVLYGLLATYFINLARRIWSRPVLVAGLVCMAVNMFFTFPTRETQTMYMMIAFMALCEKEARKIGGIKVNVGTHNP